MNASLACSGLLALFPRKKILHKEEGETGGVSTILQLVLATITSIIIAIHYKISAKEEKVKT